MEVDSGRARSIAGASALFAGVPADAVATALDGMELLQFAAESEVLVEGSTDRREDDAALYVLVEGQLTATRAMPGHRTQRLSTIGPGDFFGELARVEEGTRSATVRAVTPAVVARFPAPVADRLIASAPVVMRTIAATIARRLRAADDARIDARLSEERLSLVGKAAAMLVHDLKGPLARVLNAADCIEQGIGSPGTWTGQSRRAAEFMLAMIKDLTDFAKGEQSYARNPVRVADVVEDVEAFGLRSLESGGVINVVREVHAGDAFVTGDQRALSRALLNIVKNAGEAMPNGGTLTLHVDIDGHSARFVVGDTGGGIPDVVLPTIFEPFATYGKKMGTGLGMAMTKAAIDAHDGDIKVETVLGTGTRFVVTLPLGTA